MPVGVAWCDLRGQYRAEWHACDCIPVLVSWVCNPMT